MTHDELLERISQYWNAIPYLSQALEAVVELHKPKTFIREIPLPKELSIVKCEGCEEHYPCSTIQAIEKELK